MKENKKSNLSIVIFIVVLLIAVVGSSFGGWYFGKMDNDKIVNEKTKCEKELKNIKNAPKDEEDESSVSTEEKKCTGIYSGIAALTMNAQTGEYGKGKLTIELKEDGTYDLRKENINGSVGQYKIVDNALLLTTTPDTCGGDMDCSPKYTQMLNISEDCSTISSGYGSLFFDSNFNLTK